MSSSQRTFHAQGNPTPKEPPRAELAKAFELSAGLELQGRFRVGEKVSGGGMSDVYSGLDLETGRKVALKLAAPLNVPLDQANRFIERERLALERTRHDNIVSLFGGGRVEDRNYLVLEFIEGDSLEMRIKTRPFQWPEASLILCGLCDALAAAHLSGVIHGDLTTNNVSLSGQAPGQERPVLLDFGFVKFMDPVLDEGRTPARDIILGTMRYLAPEQTLPDTSHAFDHRADFYAFGVLAHRMLSGSYPIDGKSDYEIIMKHWSEAPPPLRSVAPDVPPEAERLVLKALSKNPHNRFQDALELKSALASVC